MDLENAIERLEIKINEFKYTQSTLDDDEKELYADDIQIEDIQAIETVLQELERYQKLCIENLARSLNESINNEENSNEQLDALNEGWKKTIEDKIEELEHLIEEVKDVVGLGFDCIKYEGAINVLQELLNGHKEEI